MYSSFQLGWRYTKYRVSAFNGKGHGMHSPFVFSFITRLLNDDRSFYAYKQIEELRENLLQNNGVLAAGKLRNGRTVRDIARYTLKPKKFAQLLFRMVDHYAPQTILELGTSFGITTAYLASARKECRVVTIEQNAAAAGFALDHFNKLGLDNIDLVNGDFDDTLAPIIQKMERVDMVLFDGDHPYESTMRYFQQLLPAVQESSILIFDNIHRNREMERAWKEIMAHDSVTLSIDLFSIGLLFFRKEQKVKQHFAIRF